MRPLVLTLALIHFEQIQIFVVRLKYVAYLFRDLGGNSNSPTEMVSTALRETLTTC